LRKTSIDFTYDTDLPPVSSQSFIRSRSVLSFIIWRRGAYFSSLVDIGTGKITCDESRLGKEDLKKAVEEAGYKVID